MSLISELKASARPAQDDDAFSGSSYVSDEYTLPGDDADDDARSIASASSYESYDSFCPRERLPSYRVPKAQGTSQPVYEAWVLCMSHDTDHEVTRLTSCGVDILSSYDEERPFVVTRTETYGQQQLSDMTLASVNSYHAANKRGFAARLFRGKPKTYEQNLDERLGKLSMSLQSELNGLLRNREEATSNRFRRRDWTVVMMREQYRYRFANATPEQVKKKGLFKGKDSRRVEYLFVIKGAEGRVAADDKGMHQPREFGNPWKVVDEEEKRLREHSKQIKRHGKNYLRDEWFPQPRRRSLSPPPGAVPRSQFQDNPRRTRTVIIERERGRPSSRSRSRSPYSPRSPTWSPVRNQRLPQLHNPFVPLPVPMGGMPPLPPTPGPYHLAPTPGRFIPPPYVPAGHHLPPFGLPSFDTCMRSHLHGPPAPSNLAPEPCTWQPLGIPQMYADAEPILQPDQFPIPIPMQQQHVPFPLEISSPPESPRPSFHCMGGAPPAMPPGLPIMQACRRLFEADFPHDDGDEGEDDNDDDRSLLQSSNLSPPPAPKPSNLTTPTEFSPASSHHTGSTVQSTDGITTPGGPGMEVFWEEGPCPVNRVFPSR
ncbi:hypothetical protein F5883DRAFT_570603 [Diaporthe sp. PMI_573]|nr:hypothetical protein F5883DRAFT_570603 [Diaporthaceae sp. PMI_573]